METQKVRINSHALVYKPKYAMFAIYCFSNKPKEIMKLKNEIKKN